MHIVISCNFEFTLATKLNKTDNLFNQDNRIIPLNRGFIPRSNMYTMSLFQMLVEVPFS